MMVKREPERIAIPMPADLIRRIDDYRWAGRLPSRAAAIRALIDIGLRHVVHHGRPPNAKDRP